MVKRGEVMFPLTGMVVRSGNQARIKLNNGIEVVAKGFPDLVRGLEVELSYDFTTNTVRDVWEIGSRPPPKEPDGQAVEVEETEILTMMDNTTPTITIEEQILDWAINQPDFRFTDGGAAGLAGLSLAQITEASDMAVMLDTIINSSCQEHINKED